MHKYETDQEGFWAGEFGDDYIARNKGSELLASNLAFFSRILKYAEKPKSLIEFGANIGMNLKALQLLYPGIDLCGIEINQMAAQELARLIGAQNVLNMSIFDFYPERTYEISLIKGVLIHINPEKLDIVYQKLYESSDKFILICEYYNPSPVSIPYRGHSERLFKRDFAGEMMAKFKKLSLLDYGFSYRKDPAFPQDDINWFLLKKQH
ncbi:MAG: pseudaminic acid biosynthesis-associated methylase [Bacteroidota bacterium]|nr:pseudaminic acid biosynthesis-associated methylase [Bacteroidota bacterium]